MGKWSKVNSKRDVNSVADCAKFEAYFLNCEINYEGEVAGEKI